MGVGVAVAVAVAVAVSGSAALGAMRRLIGRLIFQSAFDKGVLVGTAPLVSPASASASAPP